MLDLNDDAYEDDMKFQNFEVSSTSSESPHRQKTPFSPITGGNMPTTDNFPPNPNFDNPPGFNFPGGSFNPPGLPKSPPPNYIPNKNSFGVQKFSPSAGGIETQAVSANSIRFCLYKFTYIWERNGRNYWAFLLNIDRRSVSGFRWYHGNWIYFGVNLRTIDSFVCYNRSSSVDDCDNCENLRLDDTSLLNIQEDYSVNDNNLRSEVNFINISNI